MKTTKCVHRMIFGIDGLYRCAKCRKLAGSIRRERAASPKVFIVRAEQVEALRRRISRNPNSQVNRALRELGLIRSKAQ